MKLSLDPIWIISPENLKFLEILEKRKISRDKFKDGKVEIKWLLVHKLISYSDRNYFLSFSGHDCLAISDLRKKGLSYMGKRIGVGKESDIYIGIFNKRQVVLKFSRLGRTSFKKIDKSFSYKGDWLQKCNLHTKNEFEIMKKLSNLSIPRPIEINRHVIVMEYLGYYTLAFKKDIDVDKVYNQMYDFIEELYENGYVHGDFNEFNVMVNDCSDIKVIDFSYSVTVDHEMALFYLKRDIKCVKDYFKRKYRYENNREINISALKEDK
ncbi:Serine/threonine-protein kinase rio2 [Dictyocoela muelleri]|nr:Serine/threonine-protein kinase rio2 [Dictyocoela muelleri]